MEKRLKLVAYGKQLWTRERAAGIRTDINKMLGALGAGDTLVVDTDGVDVFDYSFANELFGKTLLSLTGEYPGRFVVVENLTRYTRENLSKALESLGLAMIERKRGKLGLIGKIHPADQETFSIIARAKEKVVAADLKDKLKINLTAANERLTKLTSLALVRREMGVSSAGRRQYLYSVLK
jgi:hypothetical protein